MLGWAHPDEITVTNVNGAQPDALGGQKLSYRHHGKRPYFRLLVADDAGNFRFVAVVERADLYAGDHA